MKVMFPVRGLSCTSTELLPASCNSKPQLSCKSVPKVKVNEGLSNQEIYEGIMSLKTYLTSLFRLPKSQKSSVNCVV
jgi:hypothetical protein